MYVRKLISYLKKYTNINKTVKTHVSKLRSKLKKANPAIEYIETVWGLGYSQKGLVGMMNKYVLRTKGLTKSYKGANALKDLSLTIEAGRIYGLIG